jgi:hypothetical protein
MKKKTVSCKYLKRDDFNDRYLCSVNSPFEEIPTRFVRICLSIYHIYCPNKKYVKK